MAKNSRGGQKEKFSNKISLIYFNQIDAFHVGVRGERKTHQLCLSLKDIQNALFSLFLHTHCECPGHIATL